MTSKLKKLMAFLKKNGFNAVNATDATMEELKAAFGELHKLEEAKQSPAPNFSSWPPEMPERHHKWRKSDEIQKYRLRVPEPSQFAGQRVRYRIENFEHFPWIPDGCIPIETAFKDGEFEKKMFTTEDGSRFVAWTADGKTPVFPIPL